MDCTFTHLSYGDTGYFSNIVNAYTSNDSRLQPFYKHPSTIEGIAAAIKERQQFKIDRPLLVTELTNQYKDLPVALPVSENIRLLSRENTFTVCTAHQPAIFTGSLFFVYKILHTIKLASHLKSIFPEHNFVPVFYIGSEDADLDELGNIFLEGEKIGWDTKQTGAVGRMKTKGLEKIVERIEGEYSILPHGKELVELLTDSYLKSPDIKTATLKLIHKLFGEYGLVTLIPDNPNFKKVMIPVFEDELFNQASSPIVEKTIKKISDNFKVQAQPREINLFYMVGDKRERIEREGEEWRVVNTNITFNAATLKKELYEHPERFSPNVILRGLFQETLLPDVAFIGGGGEIAYWLELKDLFDHYKVPYPVLVLRNSFVVIDEKWKDKLDKLRIGITGIFRNERDLLNDLVKRQSEKQLSLADEINEVSSYYNSLKTVAQQVDHTLTHHVAALQTRAIKPLQELEKKMLRAEKKKFDVQERQLKTIKNVLFPNNSLQERIDNFMPYYAKWGQDFIRMIYDNSFTLEQRCGIVVVN